MISSISVHIIEISSILECSIMFKLEAVTQSLMLLRSLSDRSTQVKQNPFGGVDFIRETVPYRNPITSKYNKLPVLLHSLRASPPPCYRIFLISNERSAVPESFHVLVCYQNLGGLDQSFSWRFTFGSHRWLLRRLSFTETWLYNNTTVNQLFDE